MALGELGEAKLPEDVTETTPAAVLCNLYYDHVRKLVLESRPWPWAMRQRALSSVGSQIAVYAGDDASTQFEVPYAYLETTQIALTETTGGTATAKTLGTDYTLAAPGGGIQPQLTRVAGALASGTTLTVTVTMTREGWTYLYGLPADCVTPIALLEDDTRYELYGVDQRVEWDKIINDGGNGFILACDLASTDFVLEYVYDASNPQIFSATFVEALYLGLASKLAAPLKRKVEADNARIDLRFRNALSWAAAHAQNQRNTGQRPLTPSLAARGG